MARKKARSAKQKRNDKRLGRMAKARGRKSAPKRRKSAPKRRRTAPKRKTNKPRKTQRRTVAKRSLTSRIPLVNNPTFKKAATGIGMATIGVSILSLIAPSIANQPLVKPALAFLGGDVVGLAAQIFTSGGLGGLTGGASNGGGSNAGFA